MWRTPVLKAISDMRSNIFISVLLISCTAKVSDEKRNHEAIIIHNSIMKKANQIEHRLNELRNDSTLSQDSLKLFSTLFEQWSEDIVDVPGTGNHDHSGHAHNHSTIRDITEEQILEIQRELDEQLSNIGKRMSRLKPDLIDDHEH